MAVKPLFRRRCLPANLWSKLARANNLSDTLFISFILLCKVLFSLVLPKFHVIILTSSPLRVYSIRSIICLANRFLSFGSMSSVSHAVLSASIRCSRSAWVNAEHPLRLSLNCSTSFLTVRFFKRSRRVLYSGFVTSPITNKSFNRLTPSLSLSSSLSFTSKTCCGEMSGSSTLTGILRSSFSCYRRLFITAISTCSSSMPRLPQA